MSQIELNRLSGVSWEEGTLWFVVQYEQWYSCWECGLYNCPTSGNHCSVL